MRWVNDELNEKIEKLLSCNNVKVYFILGYPISDIGKGTIAAILLSYLKNSNIIKYDSVFSLSKFKEKPDDFDTYIKFNPKVQLSHLNWITNGDIFYNFINEYGARHSTSLCPDITKYFILQILERLETLKTQNVKNLMIEIGGTIDSPENLLLIRYILNFFKSKLKENCQIILLTKLEYRTYPDNSIKTLVIQSGCNKLKKMMITPDWIFIRDALNMPEISLKQRKEYERYIANQISNYRMIYSTFDSNKIITMSNYSENNINKLKTYLLKRLKENEFTKFK